MDLAQNTIEDIMLRICHLENVGNTKGVCLYTADGMPLTDDPFFNTCESTVEQYMILLGLFRFRSLYLFLFFLKVNFHHVPKHVCYIYMIVMSPDFHLRLKGLKKSTAETFKEL